MRLSVVYHYSALLLVGVGIAMVLPLTFSICYGESDTWAFSISILVTIVSGLLLFFVTPQNKKVSLTIREALALVTLSWILVSAFGALPYQIHGTFSSYIDSFFESMSGFTTTGASVLTSIESEPHGILLWREFTQWLGGMGIVVLFVALFPLIGVGTAYLFEAESPGPEVQRLSSHIRDTAKKIWLIYIGLTLLETVLLILIGHLSFFDSLSQSFGTMATGGFSTKDASIGGFDSLATHIIILCFMLMAGINFALYYSFLWRRSLKTFWDNSEFRFYICIMLCAFLLMAWDLLANSDYSTAKAFEETAFTSASLQTSTGFAVSNYDMWPVFSRAALLTLMLIGGCAGSTAGGVKVVRIVVLFKYAIRQIRMAIHPGTIISIRIGGRVISEKIISRIIGFTVLYAGVLITGVLIMIGLGYDMTTSVSSIIATVGNVGPGLGSIGPEGNYAFISMPGKIVLMICMFIGRLEIFSVLALISPEFWRWR